MNREVNNKFTLLAPRTPHYLINRSMFICSLRGPSYSSNDTYMLLYMLIPLLKTNSFWMKATRIRMIEKSIWLPKHTNLWGKWKIIFSIFDYAKYLLSQLAERREDWAHGKTSLNVFLTMLEENLCQSQHIYLSLVWVSKYSTRAKLIFFLFFM
jgi:hypothetical protein